MVEISCGFGEISNSNENKIFISDSSLINFDFLVFFDSRGLSILDNLYKNTYLYKLLKSLKKNNLSYMAISRPKNLTIFATLYNFLKLNENLQFENLITNLGFVDCTPKKEQNIDDMLFQISQFLKSKNEKIEFEEFQLDDGKIEILKGISYSLEFKKELASCFSTRFEKLYFINTPIVPETIKIERKRPKSFFSQLEITNNLINELLKFDTDKNKLINISKIIDTYDGVHYTNQAHKKIYKKIAKELNL